LMDADQESRYLDGCHQYLTVQCGFVITDPGEPGVMREN
jgi:hypothetical protein